MLKMTISKTYLKDLVYRVNGAAIEVHKALGPGLLEKVYHECMKRELKLRGIGFQSQLSLPLNYKGITIETNYRSDLFIERILVVELKAVEAIHPVYEAQLLTYMRLLEAPVGLMINFYCVNIYKEGQKTFVNELYRHLPET